MAVNAPTDLPVAPPSHLIYRHRVSLPRAIRSVWRSIPIIRSLAERKLRARYEQAILGVSWAIIQPFVLMVAFTLLFDRVADVETNGIPYPLFSYVALLPWTFFSKAISEGGVSIIGNMQLINKIPCPREVFPLSSVVVAMVDTMWAVLALAFLFLVETFMPKDTSYWFPVLFAVQLAFTVGFSLLLAVGVVYIRDLRNAMQFVLQLGLFATPIAYGFEVIPQAWRGIYSFVNPLGPVIDGYRRTILYGEAPQLDYLALGATGAVLTLVVGYWLFKRMEAGIADVA